MTASRGPDHHDALTISEAAAASGIHPRTVRRRLDGGDFPNAFRDPGPGGPATGRWRIPWSDLTAAGLAPHHASRPRDATSVDAPGEDPTHEVARLRAELEELRQRIGRVEARVDAGAGEIEDAGAAVPGIADLPLLADDRPRPATPVEPPITTHDRSGTWFRWT